MYIKKIKNIIINCIDFIDPNSPIQCQKGLIKTYEGLVFIFIGCFIFWMFVRILLGV